MNPDDSAAYERLPRTPPARRRWFASLEGQTASAGERILVILLGYVIGGVGYVAVNHFVGAGPFHRLDLPIDHRIPFAPSFVFAYVLVYFTPAFAAVFLRDRAELYRALLAFGLNCLICFPIFLVFPVGMSQMRPLPGATISGQLLALVQMIDRPVNCFPSHHVSTAFTTFFAVRRQSPRWGALFGCVAALVSFSTLLVKQHYLVDVPAGIAVACVTLYVSFPRRTRAL